MLEEAQLKLRDLVKSIVSDEKIRSEFNLFDASVTQKLCSTRYYLDELKSLKTEKYLVLPPQDTTQSTNDPMTNQPSLLDINSYCLDLSRILDGFFMNSMSILDTLAHQIWTLHYFPPVALKKRISKKGILDIYISTITKDLLDYHPNSGVGTLLYKRLGPGWFTEFEPFRHCTTHESSIPYDVYPGYDFINKRWFPPQIKLPDNPQIRPPQRTRNTEAISFCQTIFDNIESLLNEVYETIPIDIQNNNNNLPIGKP